MRSEQSYPIVSVIVPIYNIEKYIAVCIASIIAQSYTNLEIILVNDGSTDNSGNIADHYAKNDTRIKVIHNKNEGVSSARNHGIDIATGEYITFIDGDDWVSSDYIEYLLGIAQKTKTVFAFSTKMFSTSDDRQTKADKIELWSSEKAASELLYPRMTVGSWNKIYNRSFLTDNRIRFEEELFMGEGLRFITDVAQRVKQAGVGRRKVYWYRVNNPNSCTTKHDVRKAKGALNALESIKNNLITDSPEVLKALNSHIWLDNFLAVRYMVSTNAKHENIEFYNRCKKNIRMGAISSLRSDTSLRVKLAVPLMFISPAMIAHIFNYIKSKDLIN